MKRRRPRRAATAGAGQSAGSPAGQKAGKAPTADQLTLSEEWRAWLAENAIAGASAADLVEVLRGAQVPARRARREVAAVLSSPLLARCQAAQAEARRLEMVAQLLRQAARASPHAATIERRGALGAADFLSHYVANSRPVVITDWMSRWPALASWSPARLAERFGEVEIEVMRGDTSSPALRTRGPDQRHRLLLRDFIAHITSPEAPRDLYLEAYNRALSLPELASMLEDLSFSDEIFDPAKIGEGISLWLGPAGTFTPLHHDTTDILFCQVQGRKRLWLVSPLETSLLGNLRGMWAGAPLAELRARPEQAGMLVQEVTLAAGEALYLPAGWWHEVHALETSLHLSVMHFRHAADLSFYQPGNTGIIRG